MADQLTLDVEPPRPRRITVTRRCWHPHDGSRVLWRHWPRCAWCSGTGTYWSTEARCPCGEPDTAGGTP